MDEGVAEWEKNLASTIEKTNRDINRLSRRYGCNNTNDSVTLSKAFWKRPSIPKSQAKLNVPDSFIGDASSSHLCSLNNSSESSLYTSKASSDRARPLSRYVEEDLVKRVERSVRYSIEREVDEKLAITNRAVDALLKQVETVSKTIKNIDKEVGNLSRQTASKERVVEKMNHELYNRRLNDQDWRNAIDSDVLLMKKHFLKQQDDYSNQVSSEEIRCAIKSTHSSITSTVDSILKLFQSKTDHQFENLKRGINFLKEEIEFNHNEALRNEKPLEEIQNRVHNIQSEIEEKMQSSFSNFLQKKMEIEIKATKHEILKSIPGEIESAFHKQMQHDRKTFQNFSETLFARLGPRIEQKIDMIIQEKLKGKELSNSMYPTVEEIQEKVNSCKDSMKIDMVSLEEELLAKISNESINLCNYNCSKYISKLNIDHVIEASGSHQNKLNDLEGIIAQIIASNKNNQTHIKENIDIKVEEVIQKASRTINDSEGNMHKIINTKISETKVGISKDLDKVNKKLGAMQTICKTLNAGLEMIKLLGDRVETIEEHAEKENSEESLMNKMKGFILEESEKTFLPMESKIEDQMRSSENQVKVIQNELRFVQSFVDEFKNLDQQSGGSNQQISTMLEEIQALLSSKQEAKHERIVCGEISSPTNEVEEESYIPVLNKLTKIHSHVKSISSELNESVSDIVSEAENIKETPIDINNDQQINLDIKPILEKRVINDDTNKSDWDITCKSDTLVERSSVWAYDQSKNNSALMKCNNEKLNNSSNLEVSTLKDSEKQNTIGEKHHLECKDDGSKWISERNLTTAAVNYDDALSLMTGSSSNLEFSITSYEARNEVKDGNHTNLHGTIDVETKCDMMDQNDINRIQSMEEQNYEYSLNKICRDITLENKECTNNMYDDVTDPKNIESNFKINNNAQSSNIIQTMGSGDCNKVVDADTIASTINTALPIMDNPVIDTDDAIKVESGDLISSSVNLSSVNLPGAISICDESESILCSSVNSIPDPEKCTHSEIPIVREDEKEEEAHTVIDDELNDNINNYSKNDYTVIRNSIEDSLEISFTSDRSDYGSDFESENDSGLDLP